MSEARWIYTHVKAPNRSGGFHGVLQRWWEATQPDDAKILLLTEPRAVGRWLKIQHPRWTTYSIGGPDDLPRDFDELVDLSDLYSPLHLPVFSGIIAQAVLEHVVNPFGIMSWLIMCLQPGGYIYIHTHTPEFGYHAEPIDCLRFFPDWFRTLSVYLPVTCLDLVQEAGHILVLLRPDDSDA